MNHQQKARFTKIPQTETLAQLKIRTLRMLLTVATLIVGLIWWCEATFGLLAPIDMVFYPTMIASAIASLLVLSKWPKYVSQLEILNFSVLVIYILLYAYDNLYSTGNVLDLYSAATIGQWSPLIYMIAFIFFDMRRALIASLIVYALLFIPLVLHIINGDFNLDTNSNFYLLLNMAIAHLFFVVVLTTITRLKESFVRNTTQAEFLAQIANIDYLTKIPNRRYMAQQLDLAKHQTSNQGRFAAILIDIDHFKVINDRYGHDIGDQVLIELASLVKEIIRTGDTLGRWGGEEFLLLAYYQQQSEITALTERLRVAIGSHHFPQISAISASFGVAFHEPDDTIDSLLRRADQALYRAKDLGRNRIEIAECTMPVLAATDHHESAQ